MNKKFWVVLVCFVFVAACSTFVPQKPVPSEALFPELKLPTGVTVAITAAGRTISDGRVSSISIGISFLDTRSLDQVSLFYENILIESGWTMVSRRGFTNSPDFAFTNWTVVDELGNAYDATMTISSYGSGYRSIGIRIVIFS